MKTTRRETEILLALDLVQEDLARLGDRRSIHGISLSAIFTSELERHSLNYLVLIFRFYWGFPALNCGCTCLNSTLAIVKDPIKLFCSRLPTTYSLMNSLTKSWVW